jgi:UDP-N-acetylglucosamine 1-carboxyvinyltransferase
MMDRIEAGTLIIAAAMTRGNIALHGCSMRHLQYLVNILSQLDVEFEEGMIEESLTVDASNICVEENHSVNITTEVYPGFPTDLQAQLTALLCSLPGLRYSSIKETIFENRFMHVAELRRMGAKIDENHLDQSISIYGCDERLSGAQVMKTDLRASAALVLAGIVAKGTTIVDRIYHLERGYENFDKKLRALGADIKVIN